MKDKNDSKQILDKINEQKVFTLEKFMKEIKSSYFIK